MLDWLVTYWQITFVASYLMLLAVPSKIPAVDNLVGSFLCALFGFILWPFYLAIFLRRRR